VDADPEAAWYVVQTKRHRERVAQSYLAQRNVASYLPLIVQWPRPVVGGETAPMFPGYLFVKAPLATEFTRIMWTPGVKTFVCFGGRPAPVDDGVIEFLHSREGPDGLIRCGGHLPQNSEVRIVSGPFRGLTAVVEQRLPARERVRVLMYILARQTPVELPEKWVRRV
jgi:transcription antitermination factor NusG